MQGIDAYRSENETEALEKLVLTHRNLVKKIALRVKRRLPFHIELEDLLQAGFVGLLEAHANFKAEVGVLFETFASIRIKGAILDALRRNSWATRDTIRHLRLMGEAISKIEQREKRVPTTEEIANELGISIEEHIELCQQVSMANVIQVEMIEDENYQAQEVEDNPGHIVEQEEEMSVLKKLISTLPEREQLVLSLYYNEEFTFKQISETLDLTEARVCQLHSQAIAKIRYKLQTYRASGREAFCLAPA